MKSSSIHRSRPDLGRRRFLGQAGCAGLSALPALSTLATLATTSALAADTPGGYRAVVCLLLTGGNDSFNMLAPRGTAEHAEYAQVRQDLALPRETPSPYRWLLLAYRNQAQGNQPHGEHLGRINTQIPADQERHSHGRARRRRPGGRHAGALPDCRVSAA